MVERFSKEEYLTALDSYCAGNAFALNADKAHVQAVVDGVYANLEKKGFKYCPCRIQSGDAEKDVELLCPCNFETQKNWGEVGRCWCGLFVKK